MFHKSNKQTIECSVDSCRFNEDASICGLDTIQVCACWGKDSGKPEDESMCASYKRR